MVSADLGHRLQIFEGRCPSRRELLSRLVTDKDDRNEHFKAEQLADRILATLNSGSPKRSTRPALWLRFPLISARWTARLAAPLERTLVGKGIFVLGAGPLLLPFLVAGLEPLSGVGVWEWALGVLIFFAGAIVHELGHAAALSGQGLPAGGIGGGLLFILPVLHNDVSAIAMLPRAGRLRVDLAGVILQGSVGCVLVLMAHLLDWAVAGMAARFTLMAVGWSLIPFIRSDGYHALSDGMQVDGLDLPLPAHVGVLGRLLGLLYKVVNLVFLAVLVLWIPGRWAALVGVPGWWFQGVLGLVVLRRARDLFKALVADFQGLKRSSTASK